MQIVSLGDKCQILSKETICMKCQILFSRKNKKNISNCRLLKFSPCMQSVNSFPASGDFCCLLITFANSLDPDQARQKVGHNRNPKCLTLMVFLKDFFEKVNFKNNPQTPKKAGKITQHAKC